VEPDRNPAAPVTAILDELRRGTPGAKAELFRVVYAELRSLATAAMRRQPPGHTLQPTALVHETYLRLVGDGVRPWEDRAQFFGSAARAMRSILVDFARARAAAKRGGGRGRAPLADDHAAPKDDDEVIAVHEALERLERISAELATVVELRFFGGLTVAETAAALNVTERTVYRMWNQARAWLYREIRG
jgi:RNA polymerase sigma factor (TIGR02999 family)